MPFIDPLDKVPQVPGDWANHIVYGGALGLLCDGIAAYFGLPAPAAVGTAVVLLVAAAKKAADYVEESESLAVCIGKALVTAIWPATFLLFGA